MASPRGSGLASPRGVRLLVAGLLFFFLGGNTGEAQHVLAGALPVGITNQALPSILHLVYKCSTPSPPGFVITRGEKQVLAPFLPISFGFTELLFLLASLGWPLPIFPMSCCARGPSQGSFQVCFGGVASKLIAADPSTVFLATLFSQVGVSCSSNQGKCLWVIFLNGTNFDL